MSDISKKEIGIGSLKAAIGAIPWAGTALNEAIFEVRGRIKQDRVNRLVAELAQRLTTLEHGKISEEIILSEEYGDLLEKVIKECSSRKMHENLSIIADISVEAMKNPKLLNHPMLMVFVESVSALNKPELEILKQLRPYSRANQAKQEKENKQIDFKLDYEKDEVLGLKKYIFKAAFDSLIAKGLVLDDSVGRWGGGNRDFIKPTQLCVELFKILDEIEGIDLSHY